MSENRFVDYAQHGGCSMKLAPKRLQGLLDGLGGSSSERGGWPDAVVSEVGGQNVASSVDVVLPMIDDPALFGRIVVNHVLSDIYAAGATPVFALSILGIPKPGKEVVDEEAFNREIDAEVQRMLLAANEALREAGVVSAGGHTLMDHALFFGMAATGTVTDGRAVSNAAAEPGDVLVLTKPVGTSVATKLWKVAPESKGDFGDVVEAMLRSNRTPSELMRILSRCACTDVTGFGLCGHLHNMLRASGTAARLEVAEIPIFPSVSSHRYETDTSTRLLEANEEFLQGHLRGSTGEVDLPLLLDAQVSGGLLISIPPGEADHFQAELRQHGEESWVIGEVTTGPAGTITLG
ncbi:MAG TPA: selenide, water dikinase SelD [Solirubrobacterales bacterium]|jgi:selenide,water dikinase